MQVFHAVDGDEGGPADVGLLRPHVADRLERCVVAGRDDVPPGKAGSQVGLGGAIGWKVRLGQAHDRPSRQFLGKWVKHRLRTQPGFEMRNRNAGPAAHQRGDDGRRCIAMHQADAAQPSEHMVACVLSGTQVAH